MAGRVLPVALFVMVLVAAGRPLALEGPQDATARAEERAKAAIRFVDQGIFAAALDEFKEAYRLDPRPKYLFNMGRCYDLMNRPVDAVEYYTRYLETDEPSLAKRAEVRELIGRDEAVLVRTLGCITARSDLADAALNVSEGRGPCRMGVPCWLPPGRYVVSSAARGLEAEPRTVDLAAGQRVELDFPFAGRTLLRVESSVAGAEAQIDERMPAPVPVRLDGLAPGDHRVRVSAAGRGPHEQVVRVLGGEVTTVRIDPGPPVVAAPVHGPSAARGSWNDSVAARTLRWTLFGAGIASIGVGGVLHGLAIRDARDANDDYRRSGDFAAYDGAYGSAERRMKGAWACYGIGGALLVADVVLFALDALPRRTNVTIAPVPGGVALRGAF
jgi:hypothetical protein